MPTLFHWRRVMLAAFVFASIARVSAAQAPATSFDRLRVLLKAGDFLKVTDAQNGVVEGRFLGVSAGTIALEVYGQRREFSQADVDRISRRQPASLGKGAALGFAVGAGAGLLALVHSGGSDDFGTALTLQMFATGAVGAGIGASIAAMRTTDHVLFAKPINGGTVTFAPLVDRQRRGVQVSLRF